MNNLFAQTTFIPFQFCMARFDNNENVGPTGNANALENFNTLTSRGVCSKYFIKERASYPGTICKKGRYQHCKITGCFQWIENRGFLDNRKYFIGYSSALVTATRLLLHHFRDQQPLHHPDSIYAGTNRSFRFWSPDVQWLQQGPHSGSWISNASDNLELKHAAICSGYCLFSQTQRCKYEQTHQSFGCQSAGLDGHRSWRQGYCPALRDAGMEVIYTG